MEDFWEFVNHVEDNLNYLPIPRRYIRDAENPLERFSNTQLLQRFRFTREVITDILLPLVYPNVEVPVSNRGLPIPPAIKLCTALRFYATGSFQRVCGDLQSISQATASRIVKEVSETLSLQLARYVRFPQTPEECLQNRNRFYAIGGFPGVTGCIDGMHIEIKNPGGEVGERFRNRKTWFSLNVQVVAGSDCQIMDIVIRWLGSTHDSRIFQNSSVKLRFDERRLQGLLLGDSAYPQSQYLYTPVHIPHTAAENRYNRAQIRTRNVVERTFGQWKQRFRCNAGMLSYKVRMCTRIIAATAVLHNIAVQQRIQLFDDPNFIDRVIPVPPVPQHARGNIIRAAFILVRHFRG